MTASRGGSGVPWAPREPRILADGTMLCVVCDRTPAEEYERPMEGRVPLKDGMGRIVCGPCYEAWLDTPDGLAYTQLRDAADDLDQDVSGFLRWPFPELARITTPMAPGTRPHFFCGFGGGGKTTFAWSVVNRWTEAGVRGYVLSLETTAKQWWGGLACVRLGVPPALALSGELAIRVQQWGDRKAADTLERLRAEYRRLYAEWGGTLRVSPVNSVTLARMEAEFQKAADLECQYILIDHIDHVEPDGRGTPVSESQKVNRALVRLAQQHHIIPVIASQLNMDIAKTDALSKYRAPRVSDLMFPAVKVQVAQSIIGIYRPVDQMADPDLLLKARKGDIKATEVLKPETMGLVVMKLGHSLGDAHEGARCELAVRHGRVESPSDDEHRAAEASEHAIWTGGASERPTRPRLRLDDAA